MPAAHAVQVAEPEDPAEALYAPAAHAVQADGDQKVEYLPAAQKAHPYVLVPHAEAPHTDPQLA